MIYFYASLFIQLNTSFYKDCIYHSSYSLTDRMSVSGTEDLGSIPGGSTNLIAYEFNCP